MYVQNTQYMTILFYFILLVFVGGGGDYVQYFLLIGQK